MPILIIILITGFIIGRIFNANSKINKIKHFIMPIVYVLLFFMGVLIGSNETLLSNFTTLGLNALLITLAAIGGTIFFAVLCGRLIEYLIELKRR